MQYPSSPVNPFTSATYAENCTSPFLPFMNFISAANPTPLPSVACRLLNSLALLFALPLVCFQSLAASFSKTPGVGHASPLASHRSQVASATSLLFSTTSELPPPNHRFASPTSSNTYKSLFSQILSFHIHTNCRGVSPHFVLRSLLCALCAPSVISVLNSFLLLPIWP